MLVRFNGAQRFLIVACAFSLSIPKLRTRSKRGENCLAAARAHVQVDVHCDLAARKPLVCIYTQHARRSLQKMVPRFLTPLLPTVSA